MTEEKFKNDEEYYADRSYLSNSSLKLLRESPTKFKLWRDNKWSYPNTNFFSIGSAIHALFLEGKETAVVYDGIRRGKEWEKFSMEHSDRDILNPKELNSVYEMYDKLKNSTKVQELMGDFSPEVPAVSELMGIPVKGKADALIDNWNGKYLVDLKTTAKSLSEFKRGASYMLYNQQAALYKYLFEVDDFYFVVVEKEFPYEVGIFKCSDAFLNSGLKELQTSINLYRELFLNGDYNYYYTREYEL
jgi:hypothetical protein